MQRIEDTFLGTGDLFLAKWREGYTFHLVSSVQELFLREYDESLTTIPADNNMGTTRLEDENNEDFLFLDAEDVGAQFLHGSLGVSPERMRVYWSIPEESGAIFKFPTVQPANPTRGSDYGFFNGLTNPLEEPTDFMNVTLPPDVHPAIDIYNPYDEEKEPVLSARFAHYETEVVDIEGMESHIRDMIRPDIDQDVILPMGNPFDVQKYSDRMEDMFGVRPLRPAELGSIFRDEQVESVRVE